MVIGLDIREALDNPAGKGRYVAELMKGLPKMMSEDSFRFYCVSRPAHELPSNAEYVPVSSRGPLWHRAAGHDINATCDVFLSALSYLTPQFVTKPVVLVVYDLIAFNKLAKPQKRAQLIERVTLRRSVGQAKRIVAISNSTARDLARRYPAASAKTDLAYPAADDSFRPYPASELSDLRQRLRLEEFVLCTGTIEPRKNLPRLVKAYSYLPEQLREKYPLLLVGKLGWQHQETFDQITRTRMGKFVRHMGYVDDTDLTKLYAAATVFCYPSLYEGFGLPVVEAMQSGTPVVTSNVSSLPEAAGDAAVLVDPTKPKEITAGLRQLLDSADRRTELSKAGLQHVKRFSWADTARQVADSLRSAAA